MNADELKAALDELGWKQIDLARKLDVRGATVSNWATGGTIPPWVDQYLGLMLDLDRLHRQYIRPPARDGSAGTPATKGRAARMAKQLDEMSKGGLLGGDN